MRAEPTDIVVLDIFAGQLREQHLHLMIEGGVVGGSTHDERLVTEHITQDIRVVGLRNVVNDDVLDTGFRGSTCDLLCHTFGIAVHRAITDHDTLFCLVLAHTVVLTDDTLDILMPYRSVGGADISQLHAGQLLQCLLYRGAVFSNDIRVVANHLQPESVAVDLLINHTAIQRTEATEGITTE